MRRTWRRLPEAALILTLAAAGCSGKGNDAAGARQPAGALPAGHPPISSAQMAHSPPAVVAETMDAGGYTYARLRGADGKDIWAAGPLTKLNVGDTVVMPSPMTVTNFTSKTLKRTFDTIYFTSAFRTRAEAAAAAAAATPDPTAAPTVTSGVVQQTMDASSYTYVQVKAGDSLLWLAAPKTKVRKGATVTWHGAMTMRNFTSPTLKRTFDMILFVEGVEPVKGP